MMKILQVYSLLAVAPLWAYGGTFFRAPKV